MQAMFVKLLAPLAPYLLAAMLALAAGTYTLHLRHQLAEAALANAVLAQTNQANEAAIAAYQAQAVKWNAAMDALGAETTTSEQQVSIITSKIDAQPAGADAPVAPVLAAVLDDIKSLQRVSP